MSTGQLQLFNLPTPPTPKTWMRVHRRNTDFNAVMDAAIDYYFQRYNRFPHVIRVSSTCESKAKQYLKNHSLTITLLKCPGGLLDCEADLPYYEGVG